MASRVIHFGWDDCYRVQVLRSVGYEVCESPNLVGLAIGLDGDERFDAVVLSEEEDRRSMLRAVEVVRGRAPVILFRRSQGDLDERPFDRVYSCSVMPEVWLAETASLIAQSRALRE